MPARRPASVRRSTLRGPAPGAPRCFSGSFRWLPARRPDLGRAGDRKRLPGRALHVKSDDDAKQHGLGLIGRQGRDQPDGRVRGDRVQRARGRIIGGAQLGQLLDRHRAGRRLAAVPPQVVDGAVTGNRRLRRARRS